MPCTANPAHSGYLAVNYCFQCQQFLCSLCKTIHNTLNKTHIISDEEIKIDKISSSIFEHQSHCLLYSKNFNTIFLCSGHKQINCEYLNLSEEEPKWKRLYPLQKPRENALSFVFNEKYIFLVGGKNQKGIINEDYDVIDFEIFLNNKVQNYCKIIGLFTFFVYFCTLFGENNKNN